MTPTERQTLSGEPLTIVEGVAFDDSNFNVGAVSVAASGALAYRSGGNSRRELRWFDRTGKALGALGTSEDRDSGLTSPRLSPDGRRVAVACVLEGNSDIWAMDGVRTSRVTFDAAVDNFPLWARDHIAFRSNRSGAQRLYIKPSAGAEAERLLLEAGTPLTASDWSAAFPVWGPDGRAVYYVNPGGMIMEVPVAATGGALEAGAPAGLFQPRIYGGGTESGQGPQYDVARDGRFLVNTVVDDAAAAPIVVIQNWRPR